MPAAKPTASAARLAANRANAARSTGPQTEAGKARSRANALKHGLTGAGVVLADEDAALVDEQLGLVLEEFAPSTFLGHHLARRAALLAVRERKAVAHQATRLAARRRQAARVREARLDALVEAIEANPRPYRRELLQSPEGIDRLLGALEVLLGDLEGPAPAWTEAHHRRLDALFGYRPADLPWNRPTRFSKALLGDYGAIGDAELADVADDGRTAWAMLRLVEAVAAEVEHLRAARAAIDRDELEADRALALADLAYEPDPITDRAHRYELQASRDLSRTLVDLRRVAALAQPEPEPEPEIVADAESYRVGTAPAPEPAAGDARPTGEEVGDDCRKSQSDNDVAAELGSFGDRPGASGPPASAGPIRPFHDAEPAPHDPPIRS